MIISKAMMTMTKAIRMLRDVWLVAFLIAGSGLGGSWFWVGATAGINGLTFAFGAGRGAWADPP